MVSIVSRTGAAARKPVQSWPRLNSHSSHVATFFFDVILKLASKLLNITSNRQGCSISQRADGRPHHVEGNVQEVIQILRTSCAIMNSLQNSFQPGGSFAARCALPARFMGVKPGDAQKRLYYAGLFVHDD